MKVVLSIDQIYSDQIAIIDRLRNRVDSIFHSIKKPSWHYYSRVKSKESFALKLETGRIPDPRNSEDLFACTLVVENLSQIDAACETIKKRFTILNQRPPNPQFTHKESSSFQFDDLRLYVKIGTADGSEGTPIDNIMFEIQVKTFLQHAWGIATHDLIYKSETINWSRERLAYQIKAMLEQAETMISGIEDLMKVPEVSKQNSTSVALNNIIGFLNSEFLLEDLPKDVTRLARITNDLINELSLTLSDVRSSVKIESEQGRGTNLKNLSPFLIILQCLINQHSSIVQKYLNKSKQRYKLLIAPELDLTKIDLTHSSNYVFVK